MTEMTKKPIAKFSGQDGNVFNLLGIANKALRKVNTPASAESLKKEMTERVFNSQSYEEAIAIMSEYVEVR